MFNRRTPLKDVRTPPEDTTYSPPASSEKPQHPYDLDAGRVKEMCGFDRNDPSVKVTFMPLRDTTLEDILGFERRCEDEALGLSGVTADGNNATGPVPESAEQIIERLSPAIDQIVADVRSELHKAITKHAGMHSPHEGYAVIREELDELWDEIKRDGGGHCRRARKEALQVAAMAMRYLLDIDPR